MQSRTTQWRPKHVKSSMNSINTRGNTFKRDSGIGPKRFRRRVVKHENWPSQTKRRAETSTTETTIACVQDTYKCRVNARSVCGLRTTPRNKRPLMRTCGNHKSCWLFISIRAVPLWLGSKFLLMSLITNAIKRIYHTGGIVKAVQQLY
jgi:hypothetical protein